MAAQPGAQPPPAPADAPPPPPAPAEEDEGGGIVGKLGDFLKSPTGRQIANTVTREITRSLFGTRRRR